MPHSLSRANLLSQQDYAKAITRRIDGSVTGSWISKATKNEKTVADRFRPDLDAVFDGDQLVGYREPQDRSGSAGNPDGGHTSGNGPGGRGQGSAGHGPDGTSGTGRVRENPGVGNEGRQGRTSGETDQLSGYDRAAAGVGRAVEENPAFRRGLTRLGSAGGGAVLTKMLFGESAGFWTTLAGVAVGFGIVEYSIQTEPAPTPTRRLPSGR
jgi:hypothetical protein